MQAFLTEEGIYCMVLRGVEKAALCEYAVYVIEFGSKCYNMYFTVVQHVIEFATHISAQRWQANSATASV